MPHKVTNFFRSSASSLENPISSIKTTATGARRRRDSPSRGEPSCSQSSERVFSYAASLDDDASHSHVPARLPPQLRMSRASSRSNSFSSDTPKDGGHHSHRISFPGVHFGRSSKESPAHGPAVLDWKLESPPIVFYGDAENSSGALVSGQLFLQIREDMDVDSLNAKLVIHVTQKRPFTSHCPDCTNQHTELKTWTLLPQPLRLAKGSHAFPFSILLEGHLPASMDGPLVSIAYQFTAEATTKSGFVAKLQRTLDVKRSLQAPETPHHSVRVFPPTNIKANMHYPQVMHPIGSNTLSLRLDGISKLNPGTRTVEIWKLKKFTWRLEETAKAVSPACSKHTPRGADSKKGLQRNETRVIGEKTLFSGWKSDYSSASDSVVELEFDYALAKNAKHSCDSKSRDGTEVTHQLMIEMVMSQEWAPANKPNFVTQTGVGRILRMHLAVVLTERAGIGISWDNEAPPIYQDVPPSPPAYSEELSSLAAHGIIEEHIELLDAPAGEGVASPPAATGATLATP